MTKNILINRIIPFMMVLVLTASIVGCNKNVQTVTPALPGNEFLTTVELVLVNTSNPADAPIAISTQISPYTHTYQADSVYSSQALLSLKANSTYTGRVVILDETQTPFDTVSNEILARENYHLFFFQPSPISIANYVISNTTTNIDTAYWNTSANTPSGDTTWGGWSDVELFSSAANPAFTYTQAKKALFEGADLSLNYTFFTHFTLTSKTSIVRAKDINLHQFLIGIPSDRFNNSIKYNWEKLGKIKDFYFGINNLAVSKQTRLPPLLQTNTADAAVYNILVKSPDSYMLWGADVGCTVPVSHQSISISLSVTNLTNTVFRDYLDEFRYYVNSVGRNIVLRIKVPLDFRKSE